MDEEEFVGFFEGVKTMLEVWIRVWMGYAVGSCSFEWIG